MNFEEKIKAITAERQAVQARAAAAQKQETQAARALGSAMAERDRLQQVCTEFEKNGEHEPPYVSLAKAVLAADRAAEELGAAEKEARTIEAETRQAMLDLSAQEIEARRNAAVSDFRAAVVEYERLIQKNRLAFLSDEIRRLADVASIRLEDHSPLIDRDHLSVGNYPLNAWIHSALDGSNPLHVTGNAGA